MRIKQANLAAFIEQTLVSVRAGLRAARLLGFDLELPRTIDFAVEVVQVAQDVTQVTAASGSETPGSVETTVEGAATDTTTEAAATDTGTEAAATDTTEEEGAEDITVEAAAEDLTTEAAVADTEETTRTVAQTQAETGEDAGTDVYTWGEY